MNKILSHSDVISQLSDGMTIGVGGWGARRKPMSLIRAICQSDLKDLTIVSYGGPDVGLLCAHRKVKKLIFGFVSLDMIPLDSHFRQARQNGELEVMELERYGAVGPESRSYETIFSANKSWLWYRCFKK